MRTTLCAVLLVLLAGAAFAYSTCEEDIQEELERERKEDADSQGCRACKKIELEAAPNCPAKGYDCDESLQVTSTVPSLGSCECAQLRCAAGNATLAVDGELVKKVSCKDLKWTTADGEAESAVCARECGVGICPPFTAVPPDSEDVFTNLAIRPPDNDHRCAWADCEHGAAFADQVGVTIYKGASSFACTGNRMWKYAGPREEKRNLNAAYCVKYACKELPYETSSFCDTKYTCYKPTFVELDEPNGLWGQMTCPGETLALHFTQNDTTVGQAMCALGHWQVNVIGEISPLSEVMCVNCVGIKNEPLDDQKPDDSDIKNGVTCPDGYQLTIEYGDSKTQTKVDSMRCSPDFTWITTGEEEFTGFENIDDMITKGTEWKVRCIPKECAALPFGQLNAVCTSKKYDCESATYEVDAGTGTMKCTDVGALRLDTENTAIDPKCTSGVWKNGETAIPSTSAVRCINCPVPELVNDGQNGLPTISARNKEVSCEPGKGTLTIEIVAGGATTDYPVASLTCSAEFEWVASGSLGTFPSLTDAVNQGATWKAKCVTPVVKPCATLPPSLTEPFCTKDVAGTIAQNTDSVKYKCREVTFNPNGDQTQGTMDCAYGKLSYASDAQNLQATCLNGAWRDDLLSAGIPDTTKVVCLDCRPAFNYPQDAVQIKPDTTGAIGCPSKSLNLELRDRETFAVTKRAKLSSFKCDMDTRMWKFEGEPLPGYTSFEAILEAKEIWVLRCINDGEP